MRRAAHITTCGYTLSTVLIDLLPHLVLDTIANGQSGALSLVGWLDVSLAVLGCFVPGDALAIIETTCGARVFEEARATDTAAVFHAIY